MPGTLTTDSLSEAKVSSTLPIRLKIQILMKLTNYFTEAYTELVQKVSWPTWSELRGSAVVVLVASLIIALLIFGIDVTFRGFMKVVYSFFY